jgi:integrase
MTASNVGQIVRSACKRAGVPGAGPHRLRHSAAMSLLQAGVDEVVIALLLGHCDTRSTAPYVHADLRMKERALALAAPPSVAPGRYKPPDSLLAFLEAL